MFNQNLLLLALLISLLMPSVLFAHKPQVGHFNKHTITESNHKFNILISPKTLRKDKFVEVTVNVLDPAGNLFKDGINLYLGRLGSKKILPLNQKPLQFQDGWYENLIDFPSEGTYLLFLFFKDSQGKRHNTFGIPLNIKPPLPDFMAYFLITFFIIISIAYILAFRYSRRKV